MGRPSIIATYPQFVFARHDVVKHKSAIRTRKACGNSLLRRFLKQWILPYPSGVIKYLHQHVVEGPKVYANDLP